MMKRLMPILLLAALANPAWAWDPPARNGVKPGALFKQRMSDLVDEIDDRSHELLEKMAESADESAIEAQGRFSLDASEFSNFNRFPQLSEGRVWRISNGRGSYASTIELDFETLDVTKLGSAENSAELAEIRTTMEQWQRYIRQRPRPDIDPGVWANLNEYYDDIHDWIPLKIEQADANFDHFIYVARFHGAAGVNGGRDGIAAVGLGTFNHTTSEAYLNFVTSNPYAMVRQSGRAEGVVGSAGTPLIDHGMRHLSTVEGVEVLSVSAENNRVGVYARSRGFEAVCDDALENPIFVGGQGGEDLGEGVVNPAFGGGDDDVSPYD